MNYKNKFSHIERFNEALKITQKYPFKIPIICEKYPNLSNIPDIKKHKYLVPMELTIGNFLYIIRKNINITPEKALFIYINNIIPPTSTNMITLYDNYKDEEGFLYINYSSENTFG